MSHAARNISVPCIHCGRNEPSLGICRWCQEPVCDFCGFKKKDRVEHKPEWCLSIPTPTHKGES